MYIVYLMNTNTHTHTLNHCASETGTYVGNIDTFGGCLSIFFRSSPFPLSARFSLPISYPPLHMSQLPTRYFLSRIYCIPSSPPAASTPFSLTGPVTGGLARSGMAGMFGLGHLGVIIVDTWCSGHTGERHQMVIWPGTQGAQDPDRDE